MTEHSYFLCKNNHKPDYKITFSVAETEKIYLVCKYCATIDYFSRFIIKKEKFDSCIVTNEVKK